MNIEYDIQKVNNYLLSVKRDSYIISEEDADFEIWEEYLNTQNIYKISDFKNLEAGVSLIRIHYINSKNCKPCECLPELLLELAFGGDFFIQSIFNYSKKNVC